MGIKENLAKIKEQIGNNNVKIIAVTKYANDQQIKEAYNLGIKDFGESYVQNALEKISREENLQSLIQWHFIGRLQKNKVKYIIGKFNLIHSVDSIELAEIVNNSGNRKGVVQDILLQVNISQEATKAGFNSDDLKSSFERLIQLPNIKILGLTTIAPNTTDKGVLRSCFLKLSSLKEELNKNQMEKAKLKELSMGMSNDYVTAIECGSTMIRIGRAIFMEEQKIEYIK